MAIDYTVLKTEIETDPLGLKLIGAGNKKIAEILNTSGTASTETWVVSDTPVCVSKLKIFRDVSNEELAAFHDLMASDTSTGKALSVLLNSADGLDMTYERTRSMIIDLAANGIISEETKTNLLRMGEVLQSRAEELFGQKITVDDVAQAREV